MKTEIKEAKKNEINWSKKNQLVIDDHGGVVFVTGVTSDKTFSGFVVHPPDGHDILGDSSDKYFKSHFKPFHGSVTLSND